MFRSVQQCLYWDIEGKSVGFNAVVRVQALCRFGTCDDKVLALVNASNVTGCSLFAREFHDMMLKDQHEFS